MFAQRKLTMKKAYLLFTTALYLYKYASNKHHNNQNNNTLHPKEAFNSLEISFLTTSLLFSFLTKKRLRTNRYKPSTSILTWGLLQYI